MSKIGQSRAAVILGVAKMMEYNISQGAAFHAMVVFVYIRSVGFATYLTVQEK